MVTFLFKCTFMRVISFCILIAYSQFEMKFLDHLVHKEVKIINVQLLIIEANVLQARLRNIILRTLDSPLGSSMHFGMIDNRNLPFNQEMVLD